MLAARRLLSPHILFLSTALPRNAVPSTLPASSLFISPAVPQPSQRAKAPINNTGPWVARSQQIPRAQTAMATYDHSASYDHASPVGPSVCVDKVVVEEGKALAQARELKIPSREAMLRRDQAVDEFWMKNRELLEQAWIEWGNIGEGAAMPQLDESLIDPELRTAVADAWDSPETMEQRVMDLWKEVSPGVYACQFFDPEQIHKLRAYIDGAPEAGVPLRPPYGIVLNRKGYMLDSRSVGYLAVPEFQRFYKTIMDTYMRPLGRLFYPDYVQRADDSQTFGFSIAWQPSADRNIQQHTDASAVTLNLNLNLPDDHIGGSSLYFVNPYTRERDSVSFVPGMAVIHRGAALHASLPITEGERHNLVLWTYGQSGYFSRSPYQARMTPRERWTKPEDDPSAEPQDAWTPF